MTDASDGSSLPIVDDNALTGHHGEAAVNLAVTKLGFIFRDQTKLDFGIDGTIEVTREAAGKRVATGRQVAVQIKRGDQVVRKTRYGYTLYCSEAQANYWLGHSLPVIAVYSHPGTNRLHWRHVTSDALRTTPKGFALDIGEDSDLECASEQLVALAETGRPTTFEDRKVVLLPFDESTGITMPEEELGLACLELARAAARNRPVSIEIEVVHEAELIASVDAIRDLEAPTADQRRDALIREDILDRYTDKAAKLKRALTWLLTDPMLSRFIGYDDRQLAAAVKTLAEYFVFPKPRTNDHTWLDAWPGPGRHKPVVKFSITTTQTDQLYARSDMTEILMRMGDAGGVVSLELGEEALMTRFIPALVRYLMNYADALKLRDMDVLNAIDVEPDMWSIGIS